MSLRDACLSGVSLRTLTLAEHAHARSRDTTGVAEKRFLALALRRWRLSAERPVMRIPRVRFHLHMLANRLERAGLRADAARLRRLIGFLKRRTKGKTHRRVSQKMTPALRASIRAFKRAHPELTQHEIALRFEVNSGRVSEALHGKRR